MLLNIKKIFSKHNLVLIGIILLVIIGGFTWKKATNKKTSQPQYQTAQVEKGTLTITVSSSGQVLAANSAAVETKASGVVSKVYVENGQQVNTGDTIAQLDLDLEGKQRAAQSWANYQSAKNNLASAKAAYYTLQSDMMSKWDSYMNLAQNSTYQNADKSPNTEKRQAAEFISTDDDWLATEAKYKNQEGVVNQAQTSLNSAWLSYQQTSPAIYAPITGTVTGLSLQIGSVLTAQTNTSGTSTSQKIASIQTDASPLIKFDLSQIDTPKVKVGNLATLIFDAFPNKTYTGKVISIDTIGIINSGVTTYPAVIKLDTEVPEIFSNMTASANIITQIKDNVLLIPIGAVQTQNEQTTIQVLKNGKLESVYVETGLSSSSQMEIITGLNEGDSVVTSTTTTNTTDSNQKSSQTRSIFSGFGGGSFRP